MKHNYIIKSDGTYWRKSTLAHRLDKRAVSYGEPTPLDLPATLNPLKFLMQELLGNHLAILKVRQDCIPSDLTFCFPLLRQLLPAEDAVLIVKELEPLEDRLLPSSISDEEYQVLEAVTASETFSREGISDES